jgi:glycosyltransferase involved in cell wall biosynthesis
MRCSVVIPTLNRADVLSRTLTALGRQSICAAVGDRVTPPFEVIVVDNGSSDGTAHMVAGLAAKFPVPLSYLHSSRERNAAAARNEGSQSASGEYLVFLGDDTAPVPGFLERHLAAHGHRRNRPEVAVIGHTSWPPDSEPTRFMKYVAEQGWQFGFALIDDPENVPFNFFYTSNISMARDLFAAEGGFDEAFPECNWEDIELGWRLNKRGMQLVYEREARAYHYHPISLASFVLRQRQVGRSAWTFYRKHPEMAEFLGVTTVSDYSAVHRVKMKLLTWFCRLTERSQRLDLRRYYAELLRYYYFLGILDSR